MQIDFTQMNFSTEPDIFKCYEHCRMNYIKHNYIGFQRNKCLCFYNVDIEIVLCNNTNVTVCGYNQNFICGGRDNVTVIYEIKSKYSITRFCFLFIIALSPIPSIHSFFFYLTACMLDGVV